MAAEDDRISANDAINQLRETLQIPKPRTLVQASKFIRASQEESTHHSKTSGSAEPILKSRVAWPTKPHAKKPDTP